MDIIVENSSSPGASFTENTNGVLLKILDWLEENNYPTLALREFRLRLEKEKGINDNNARNIYPLLKNCGFVNYEKNGELDTKTFFTARGLAYVKALQLIKLLNESDYTTDIKKASIQKAKEVLEITVYKGLRLLLSQETNYNPTIRVLLQYLLAFSKVDKNEYAYLLYCFGAGENTNFCIDDMQENVCQYRDGKIKINVKVRVRNDKGLRDKTNETNRLEGIDFLTSYSFFTTLLVQAGLITKSEGYFLLKQDKRDLCESILEVTHG